MGGFSAIFVPETNPKEMESVHISVKFQDIDG